MISGVMRAAPILAFVSAAAVFALAAGAPPSSWPTQPRDAAAEDFQRRSSRQPDALHQAVPIDVLRVIDGDTIEIRARIWLDQWLVTRVRLRGIDAPERRSRCPLEASQAEAAGRHLAALAAAEPVFLTELGQDKYGGRVVGRIVTASGVDLAGRMLADGQARAYAGGRRQSWC